MARSRSGTRNRRGSAQATAARGRRRRVVGPGRSIRASEARSSCRPRSPSRTSPPSSAVNPADVIRELIKSGIFASINQLIDRDTASLVAGELGYEVAETVRPRPARRRRDQRRRRRRRRRPRRSSSRRTTRRPRDRVRRS